MTSAWLTTEGPKQRTRALFVDAIKAHIEEPREVFILPGENANDAYALKQEFPYVHIVGAEAKKAVHAVIKKEHWRVVDVKHGTIGDYVDDFLHRPRRSLIKKYEEAPVTTRGRKPRPSMLKCEPFDAIWLDHTGVCSTENATNLVDMVTHTMQKKSIVGVTFSKTRAMSSDVYSVIRNNVWLENDERYDEDGQAWVDDGDKKILLKPEMMAAAICSAIEKGYVGPYVSNINKPNLYKRLEVLHSEEYNTTDASASMFFFILLVERY